MKASRSFQWRLVVGSALWTVGVLLSISVLLIVFLALHPQPHQRVYRLFSTTPAVVTLSLGAAAMIAGGLLIHRAIAALSTLRSQVALVRRGDRREVAGAYPSEVQPLVDELNGLLTDRDTRLQRALERAADLAHGLKTPLAVLTRDADHAAAAGHHDLAESLRGEIDRMRRQIDYHLAHARAGAHRGQHVRTNLAASVDGLRRTLERLHTERSLGWAVMVGHDAEVACQREDVDEMLGNLLDNACTWAQSRVVISTEPAPSTVVLTVDDDGPGVDEALRVRVLERGTRADERTPGSGIGLAIVRDLAELYGGSVTLDRSPIGGLRVRLVLPSPNRTPVAPPADAGVN